MKKELLKTVDLMEQTGRMLSSINRKRRTEIVNTLAQCQEAAQKIGDYLETLDGQGRTIVPLLEEYCESLYQMSRLLENKVQYEKQARIIRKQLISIRKKIQSELPEEKKEVVFLPYKASMWDSLESVWRAALKDEQCKAYVVPIPYYDRNQDGTLGQMHYEGDLYPADVPITSWETYRIAERHPDMIYIHNPYDQYNYVTSVHPDFFSAKLKQYTDMLVYVPYFISTTHHVAEHFCTLPGTFYADRVVVEDEEVRKFYIEQFHKYEKENHCYGVFGNAEKKFLALGSPKFDKVFSTRREDLEVPPDWEALMYKEDGTRKKIIFYNTTVDALLNDETYTEKIRSTLRFFYDYRKEVTVLWRPHPLNVVTMQAMRPSKLIEYNKLIEDYRAAGYGIYDDSAELHRAIALSDAYFGDWSSVVSLYEKTGKPIYYKTKEDLFLRKKTFYVYFSAMFSYKDSVYGFACKENMILKIDFRECRTHYFMKLNNESEDNRELYFAYIVYQNKLYMIPAADSTMLIYDFDSRLYEKVKLCPMGDFIEQGKFFFVDGCRYGNYLYLVPFNYTAIVRYDLNTRNIKEIPLFDEDDNKNNLKFGFLEFVDENQIAIPSGNGVIIFNLIEETWHKYIISTSEQQFNIDRVFSYKQQLWLIPADKLVFLRWDYLSGELTQYKEFPKGCKRSEYNFGGRLTQIIDHYIYCFPAKANMAVKINLDTGKISEITQLRFYCESADCSDGQQIFANLIRIGNKILLQYQKNMMVIYDTEKDTAYSFSKEMSNTPYEQKKMNEDFIEDYFRPEIMSPANSRENAGEKIHDYIKNELE